MNEVEKNFENLKKEKRNYNFSMDEKNKTNEELIDSDPEEEFDVIRSIN